MQTLPRTLRCTLANHTTQLLLLTPHQEIWFRRDIQIGRLRIAGNTNLLHLPRLVPGAVGELVLDISAGSRCVFFDSRFLAYYWNMF
jgi:hypothetical protein